MDKREWHVIGVQILAEVGPDGLTIDALCQRAGVTKGSFYHHFGGTEAYKHALLAFYEEEGTLDIIAQLADIPTPQAKLHRLIDIVVQTSTQPVNQAEVVLRAWAVHDTAVQEVQQRIDGRRLAYVQGLLVEMGHDEATAETLALLMYAILVGGEQMHPAVVGEQLRGLFAIYLQVVATED